MAEQVELTWANELTGYAVAFNNNDRGRDAEGNIRVEHGMIRTGPRMVQAKELPHQLASDIEEFLQHLLAAEDECDSRAEALLKAHIAYCETHHC